MAELVYIAEALRALAVPVGDVYPDAENVRAGHDVERLAASLQAYGQRRPLVVNRRDGRIEAGNGVYEAALSLGWSHVAVVYVDDDPASAVGYSIADNRLGELSGWDVDRLAAAVSGLEAFTGFTAAELDDLLPFRLTGRAAQADPGAREEQGAEFLRRWPVDPGQVWRLGAHRVVCGDSTDGATVARLLAGARPGIMVTDPPYGVRYDPAWRREAQISQSERMGAVENDYRAGWSMAFQHFLGDVAYVWYASLHGSTVERALRACRFSIRAQIIWVKQRFAISRDQYHWRHEACLYGVREGRTAGWGGGRKQQTVWGEIVDTWQPGDVLFASQVDEDRLLAFDASMTTVWEMGSGGQDTATIHSTQKPLECFERPLRNHLAEEVYDPFCGSGTAVIACERLGRRCYAVELNPVYVAITIDRWATMTGREPVLEGRR